MDLLRKIQLATLIAIITGVSIMIYIDQAYAADFDVMLDDSLSISDSITKGLTIVITDNISISDSVSQGFFIDVVDTVSFSDSVNTNFIEAPGETVTQTQSTPAVSSSGNSGGHGRTGVGPTQSKSINEIPEWFNQVIKWQQQDLISAKENLQAWEWLRSQ